MLKIVKHIGFWILYIVFIVSIYYVQEPNLGLHLVYELASLPAKLFCVYFSLYVILPRFLLEKKYGHAALQFAFLLVVGVFLLRFLVVMIVYPIYFPGAQSTVLPSDPSKLISPLLDLMIATTLATIIKLLHQREREEFNRLRLEKSNIQNELELLKSQLHPHFLFNTLNGLYSQILTNPDMAANMVVALSDLLRYIIYEGRKVLVQVRDDLDCVENYIALERTRHASRLDLKFSVAGTAMDRRIPPLLLLPFVENAFKHGVSRNYDTCWIYCDIQVNEEFLVFNLKNSVDHDPEDTLKPVGIGISNVRQRLEYLHPGQFSLETQLVDKQYYVRLKIPIS